jgi:hypothetical protein
MVAFAALFAYKVEMKRYQQGIADNNNETGIALGIVAKEVVSKTSELLLLLLTAAAFRMYLL